MRVSRRRCEIVGWNGLNLLVERAGNCRMVAFLDTGSACSCLQRSRLRATFCGSATSRSLTRLRLCPRLSSRRLLGDLKTLGFLFESLVLRDLRIYGQRNDAAVYHYRDSDELEADMIVQARDRRWIAVEAKLGGEQWIDEAADSLLKLSRKVDTDKMGAPSKLLIITATGYGYDRPDGTTVVPITALAP